MKNCLDHLDFINKTCPDCELLVDEFGNTEDRLEFCSFPYCGCDGNRNCMAERGPSEHANKGNREGMWNNGSDKECRKAAFYTMDLVSKMGSAS